jgi:hypothetical protein
MPLGFLNMLFRDHRAAWSMKPRAVDQTGLKSLQLLAGDNMIVNVDNHNKILSAMFGSLPIRERRRAARRKELE